jgi:hypothetical protein
LDSDDLTGNVSGWWAWIARDLAEHVEDVSEVESYCTDTEQHLSIGEIAKGIIRLDIQVADCASLMEVQPRQNELSTG